MTPIIRDYRPGDLEQLQQIHEANGFDFRFPEVGDPLFVVRKVLESEDRIIGAIFMRIELEAMLWLDTSLSSSEKVVALETLHPAAVADAWAKGADTLVAWIPAEIEGRFAKRLTLLGWSRDRDGWHSWSRSTSKDGK